MGTLVWTELRTLSRNTTFLLITIALPVVFFLVMSEVFGGQDAGGFDMARYMMISMAAFAAMSVSIAVGTRVGQERLAGWNRQLRLTPLPGWAYVASKVVVALALVLPAVALVFLAGLAIKGVSLSGGQWLGLLVTVWLGSLPFGVIGLALGLAVKPDAAEGVGVAVYLPMAMLGGLWVPVEVLPPFMAAVAKALPSYWVAENARRQLADGLPGLAGPAVALGWFAVVGIAVAALYRRDAARI
ncbi:ABC transporter permease [Bailinhaonella thermotolerans]|uniref:ABC transporter permease n=1 Tax=Bailinhaonella thermotolerans TaxID=1070861 RepID=A0A3A4ASX0_9ACTN|nr:ABC transporter permease [Bailinhaonella thermotolerans]RJL24448.1 ABC transporter permease [Bailinhaonella thermotolerans]